MGQASAFGQRVIRVIRVIQIKKKHTLHHNMLYTMVSYELLVGQHSFDKYHTCRKIN
jgi:hypothetical protein